MSDRTTDQIEKVGVCMKRAELTMEDLITLILAFEGEFIIHIECREVGESNE